MTEEVKSDKDVRTDTADYWEERWKNGQTGWRRTPGASYQSSMEWLKEIGFCTVNKSVLVPLCGDSPVIQFLAEAGFQVYANDWSHSACEQLRCILRAKSLGHKVELFEGDFYDHIAQIPANSIDLVWDRGAFVAVPPDTRDAYAKAIAPVVRPGGCIFLNSVYKPLELRETGPPYHVTDSDIEKRFSPLGFRACFTEPRATDEDLQHLNAGESWLTPVCTLFKESQVRPI